MTIHREGTASLIISAMVLILVNIGIQYFLEDWPIAKILILLVSIILFLIVLQFFRSPKRTVILNENHIIAPADGKVVVIEETMESEYFNGPRKQISIFMSPFNVHINFNPIAGIVTYFKYHSGKFLVAWHPKSSTDNERTTIVVKHKNGTEILFRQIAGALARRICWYIKEGQQVEQGKEFGFIKFGSRIDIYLPITSKILLNLEDKTIGGETVIAHLD